MSECSKECDKVSDRYTEVAKTGLAGEMILEVRSLFLFFLN